ncbi:MAG: hypothetical protein EA397_14340 [Deltaproteobacteria bacterium]|nr:MAG: hypothetical protein EA397_14340 [Deltaproteobacteria bacterium]
MASIGEQALVEEALENLVNQFARPLDCLRELVQNSLDAGTPRIEVAVDYAPEDDQRGVVTLHVDDFGEGMNEEIIDNQLTRMFSSTKEGDLTRIGKFGIGFTSIFAMRPEAVLLHTGRHGEYWELLFHADRSYDKVRVDRPVTGTRITIYRRARAAEVPGIVREARDVLTYWCEHSTCPISFEDRTLRTESQASVDDDDPFAAFAEEAEPVVERISRPMDLPETLLNTSELQPELELHVGLGGEPLYGYYNGGLTLVRGTSAELLGSFAQQLRHVSFKVRADRLDHTLTRDSVLRNENWAAVLREVVRVAGELTFQLIERAEQACEAGEDLSAYHQVLALVAQAHPSRASRVQRALRGRKLFYGHEEPISFDLIESQESRTGGILLHPGDGPLATAIHQARWLMVRASPETETLLRNFAPPVLQGLLRTGPRLMLRAQDRFVLPRPIDDADLDPQELKLLERLRHYMARATQGSTRVHMGDLSDQGLDDEFFVEAPPGQALYERGKDGLLRALWRRFTKRQILVRRDHHLYQTALAASWSDVNRAATALAYAILVAEGRDQDAMRRLLHHQTGLP